MEIKDLQLDKFNMEQLGEIKRFFQNVIDSGEYIADGHDILQYQINKIDDEIKKRQVIIDLLNNIHY